MWGCVTKISEPFFTNPVVKPISALEEWVDSIQNAIYK